MAGLNPGASVLVLARRQGPRDCQVVEVSLPDLWLPPLRHCQASVEAVLRPSVVFPYLTYIMDSLPQSVIRYPIFAVVVSQTQHQRRPPDRSRT